MSCRAHVLDALRVEMKARPTAEYPAWVENERMALVTAANEWANRANYDRRLTPEMAELLEQQAIGHVDYASKWALYVAEFIVHDPCDGRCCTYCKRHVTPHKGCILR